MRKYSRSCVDKEFAAAEKLGIRLCFGRGSLDLGPEDGNNISSNLLQTVDEIIADSENAIKKYHDGSFNSMRNVILAPCPPFSSSKECYIKTAELARKYHVRLNSHLAETLDEEKWCKEKYNKRTLEFIQECNFIGGDVFFNHRGGTLPYIKYEIIFGYYENERNEKIWSQYRIRSGWLCEQ